MGYVAAAAQTRSFSCFCVSVLCMQNHCLLTYYFIFFFNRGTPSATSSSNAPNTTTNTTSSSTTVTSSASAIPASNSQTLMASSSSSSSVNAATSAQPTPKKSMPPPKRPGMKIYACPRAIHTHAPKGSHTYPYLIRVATDGVIIELIYQRCCWCYSEEVGAATETTGHTLSHAHTQEYASSHTSDLLIYIVMMSSMMTPSVATRIRYG